MNSLGKMLGAAALVLTAGCASPRREPYRHEPPYTDTAENGRRGTLPLIRNDPPIESSPSTDTRLLPLPPPTPTTPPSERAIIAYERAIPPQIITNPDPAENQLEQTIREQHRVIVQGDVSLPMLAETKRVLENMPRLDPCPIYFIPDTLNNRQTNLAGWYQARQADDRSYIAILKPVGKDLPLNELRATLIHELAHRGTRNTDTSFAARWVFFNTHEYGTDLNNQDGNYHWLSEPRQGARYGFVSPYGAKNSQEDIATLVEAIRTGTQITIQDDTTATVLNRKRNLLLEYQFIHPHEQLNIQGKTEESIAVPLILPTLLKLAVSSLATAYIASIVIRNGIANYRLRRRRNNRTETQDAA